MSLKLAGRYRGWASIGAVAAALLVFAAPASAEVLTGQTTAAANPAIPAEADIVAASASYDSTAGTVTFNVTTAAPPTGDPELTTIAALTTGENLGVPQMGFLAPYTYPEAEAYETEVSEHPAYEALVPQPVVGATKTLTVTEHVFANRPYNYAAIAVLGDGPEGEEPEYDVVRFPIAAAPAPAPPPPAAAPPAFEMAKIKPVKALSRRWTKVKVTLGNAGGTATSPIALKVKAPRGIRLDSHSGRYVLPALEPNTQETFYFKVKVGQIAKPKSQLIVSAAASGQHLKTSVPVETFH